AAMARAFGADRQAAVCRELTKTYEEVRRGGLAELAAWAEAGVKGEITIVVAGHTAEPEEADLPALVAEVDRRVAAGEQRKTAVAEAARAAGVPKRELYDAAHRRSGTPYSAHREELGGSAAPPGPAGAGERAVGVARADRRRDLRRGAALHRPRPAARGGVRRDLLRQGRVRAAPLRGGAGHAGRLRQSSGRQAAPRGRPG